MERLSKLCKPSRYLTFSQLLMLKKVCEQHQIQTEFIHKFLIKFSFENENGFLKINPYDSEFFFISKTYPLKTFSSFEKFKIWFGKEFLKGVENYE